MNTQKITNFVILLFLPIAILGCSRVDTEQVALDEPQIITVTETKTPTKTLIPTQTYTPTFTLTPTLTPTPTITPTFTSTPLPTFDTNVGPAIVVVTSEQDPVILQSFLEEAVNREYQFADFYDYSNYNRPLIMIFDEMRISGIRDNQSQMVEIMSKFGTGVIAGLIDNRTGGPGAKYIYDLVNVENWQLCMQGGDDFLDLSTAEYSYALDSFARFQNWGVEMLYPNGDPSTSTPVNFPICWVPYNGVFSDAVYDVIHYWNGPFAEQWPLAARDPLTILVSSYVRNTINNYLEVYPSIRELDFSLLPY